MLVTVGAAFALVICLQVPADERLRAEQLARDGRTADAMVIFGRIVEQDPRDDEARLWVARLALRLGRTSDAEAGFRAVLTRRPSDVDAAIGLGMTLLRTNDWRGALAVLEPLEANASDNADLLATLARAYRRGGDDRRAMQYFARAHARAPDDWDITAGYEAVARVYRHLVVVEGMAQGGEAALDATSGAFTADLRIVPAVRVQGYARAHRQSGISDATVGAGVLWRVPHGTTIAAHVLGGADNVVLPQSDASGELRHYAGRVEVGAGIRALTFDSSQVVAVSPVLAWDQDRWRIDTRYTWSRSTFDATAETSDDHSAFVRGTARLWRRAAVLGAYAYGIESFEDLTVDRLGSLGTTTAMAGLQIDLPSLSRVVASWEHQWRSNDTSIDRVTVTLVQALR